METSRQRVGKFQLKLAQIDMRDVVRQAIEAASFRHRDKKQRLQTNWPAEPVIVQGKTWFAVTVNMAGTPEGEELQVPGG